MFAFFNHFDEKSDMTEMYRLSQQVLAKALSSFSKLQNGRKPSKITKNVSFINLQLFEF